MTGLIDAHELENEVAETAKVEDDDDNHAGLVLAAGEERGCKENEDGDGDGGDGQRKLGVVSFGDNDNELDDEAEEEEEIELEECNVDLEAN